MASLSAEKAKILGYIAAALGEPGAYDAPLGVSFPPYANEFQPERLTIVESVELHLGIPCDRTRLQGAKPLKADLYLPGRDLYIELDRGEHDLQPDRETTLLYYPPGLPRGFRVDRYRELIQAERSGPGGTTAKMNAGRALSDFVKDLYVEGELGKVLVRVPKHELAWLLAKGDEAEKRSRLAGYLRALAEELELPALNPV